MVTARYRSLAPEGELVIKAEPPGALDPTGTLSLTFVHCKPPQASPNLPSPGHGEAYKCVTIKFDSRYLQPIITGRRGHITRAHRGADGEICFWSINIRSHQVRVAARTSSGQVFRAVVPLRTLRLLAAVAALTGLG
jgi:hypothetical protein